MKEILRYKDTDSVTEKARKIEKDISIQKPRYKNSKIISWVKMKKIQRYRDGEKD